MEKMKEYLICFMEGVDFPEEARKVFLDVNYRLKSNDEYAAKMDSIIDRFYNHGEDPKVFLGELTDLAKEMEINHYTIHMLFFMYCSKILLENYKKVGVSLDIFWDSMKDLKYKLIECKEVHGIWGTFVGEWFPGFFTMERFALGRLQYEVIEFSGDEYTKAGYTIKKGDKVRNVHIPSAGPLTEAKLLDSYKRAYEFYKDDLKGGPLVLVCYSWLLYPDNEKFYPKNSNILGFARHFDIIDSEDQDTFIDAWRVFGKDYQKPADELPRDTSLRRAYADWLEAGNKTGFGFGILFFDGNKIL